MILLLYYISTDKKLLSYTQGSGFAICGSKDVSKPSLLIKTVMLDLKMTAWTALLQISYWSK